MGVMLSGNVILDRASQSENASSPMVVMLPGNVILDRNSQKENASSPMVVMLLGNVILDRDSHIKRPIPNACDALWHGI